MREQTRYSDLESLPPSLPQGIGGHSYHTRGPQKTLVLLQGTPLVYACVPARTGSLRVLPAQILDAGLGRREAGLVSGLFFGGSV